MVADPLERINTNDNTPAILHTEIVDGDRVTLPLCQRAAVAKIWELLKHCFPAMVLMV